MWSPSLKTKPHLALRLPEVPSWAWEYAALASLGSQALSTASRPQQSHEQSRSILSVSWQDFVHQIIMFRRRFGRKLSDARGSMSAASTSPLSSYVAWKVETCSSKNDLALVFSPLSTVTNCALSHVLFFHADIFHMLSRITSGNLLHLLICFALYQVFWEHHSLWNSLTWIMVPLAFRLNPFVDGIWSIHCSDN